MSQNKVLSLLKSEKFWVELAIMTFTMFFAAVAVHYFLQPSGLVIGSISGLSIVLYKITSLPVSAWTFIINLILLILAYFLIGKEFGAKTVYTALILSPWLMLLEWFDKKMGISAEQLFGWQELGINKDPWFYLILFILLLSASQAILFKINASTGGLDILAKIVNKYLHVDIGTAVTISGAVICCSAFFVPDNSLYYVVLGLVATWLNGIVLDRFTAGLNSRKKVCIICKNPEPVQNFIINELQRGVTLYDVKGGFKNAEKVEVVSIITQQEFAKLHKYLTDNEMDVFMTVGTVGEIYGFWNKRARRKSK
jgi:uncharacterized membrane-anchored protein YitT (DUF2179 family)